MIKALLRFTFFEIPIAILAGFVYILFDKQEVIQTNYVVRKQWRPDVKKQILANYLEECFKLVQEEHKKDKDEK